MNLKRNAARGVIWLLALTIVVAVLSPIVASFIEYWKVAQWYGVLAWAICAAVLGLIVWGILKLIGWAIDNC